MTTRSLPWWRTSRQNLKHKTPPPNPPIGQPLPREGHRDVGPKRPLVERWSASRCRDGRGRSQSGARPAAWLEAVQGAAPVLRPALPAANIPARGGACRAVQGSTFQVPSTTSWCGGSIGKTSFCRMPIETTCSTAWEMGRCGPGGRHRRITLAFGYPSPPSSWVRTLIEKFTSFPYHHL